jgi:hypothetical protein
MHRTGAVVNDNFLQSVNFRVDSGADREWGLLMSAARI